MVRSVAWFLVVSLLTLNLAWAFDNCAFSDPRISSTGAAPPLDSAPANIPGTIPTCNHWCPGWTHLITLPGSSVQPPDLQPAGFDGRPRADRYVFLPAPPPTHPPATKS